MKIAALTLALSASLLSLPAAQAAPMRTPGTQAGTAVAMKLAQTSVKLPPKPKPKPAPKPAKKVAPQPTSRLAGYKWGVYKGPADQMWNPYLSSRGDDKATLAELVNQPKAQWFGGWIGENEIGEKTRAYIENAQAGDKDALVQLTIFRMDPWEHEGTRRQPSAREIREYKTWIDRSAAAIGNTRAAIIVQPDLPFLMWVPNPKLSGELISYAVQKYSALPRSLVYLEAGTADWPAPGQGGAPEAVRILKLAGIQYADGIATNTTHYTSTADDVHRSADIIRLLHEQGYDNDYKAVINTSSNGQPFIFGNYQGPDPDEAFVCRTPHDGRTCVALGIPPTADVDNPKWGLDAETQALARQYVDGYLWIGRPWLKRQNSPFLKDKALTLVRQWSYR